MTLKNTAWHWACGIFFFLFLISFYLPVHRAVSREIFYFGIALPAFVWWLRYPKVAGKIFALAPRIFLVAAILAVCLGLSDWRLLRNFFYIFCLFLACVMLERGPLKIEKIFGAFAIVGLILLIYATGSWLITYEAGAKWPRIGFWGLTYNPARAAVMVMSGLIFLWLFVAEPRLRQKSNLAVWAGEIGLAALCLIGTLVFGARSTLLGFVLFYACYCIQRRTYVVGLLIGAALLLGVFTIGTEQVAFRDGDSHRLEIWADTVRRLTHDCNILLGCGDENHLFLGEFFHQHNSYLAAFYVSGLAGGSLYLCLLVSIVVKAWGSRWLLLTMLAFGWCITDGSTMISKPFPYYVFFWLPLIMALLESGRAELDKYYSLRTNT